MDIMGIQKQISTLDDSVLSRALNSGGDQVPHLMVMMEVANRRRMREQPQQPARRMNMMQEMQSGQYSPVPTPPLRWPDLAAYQQNPVMPGQSTLQKPNENAGIGALFSQNSLG